MPNIPPPIGHLELRIVRDNHVLKSHAVPPQSRKEFETPIWMNAMKSFGQAYQWSLHFHNRDRQKVGVNGVDR